MTMIEREVAAWLLNVFPSHQTHVGLAQRSTLDPPMTPLTIISDWFEEQDTEVQVEIAGMAALLMFDGAALLDLGSQEQVEFFRHWLSEAGLQTHMVVGRVLTFRACFEYFAENKFTDFGWRLSEKALRKAIEESERAANFSDSMRLASNARRVLDVLPARKSKWIEVGKSWRELADACLTSSALRNWASSQTEQSPDGGRAG
ncbi:hypothetical protein CQ12_40675 [Bradyrhizobium jicamae]|uniref:Uncharacterized protein n=1 Tax=Bradyrhizobium jicamae TaxID=280332 RepID=A0A0R3LZ57_9BRAD|nr:hypothetical protein [Bradyrhizobium jicamae]KRR10525.1 hypothetical protein CQ12_40675 [Bradyrhizobium jicamae]